MLLFVVICNLKAQRKGYENYNDLFRKKNTLAHYMSFDFGVGYSIGELLLMKKLYNQIPDDYYNRTQGMLPTFHCKAELALMMQFGLMLDYSYTSHHFKSLALSTVSTTSVLTQVYHYDLRNHIHRLNFKTQYYLMKQRFHDIYLSLGAGITFYKKKFNTTDPKLRQDDVWYEALDLQSTQLNIAAHWGYRWWPTRNLGIHIKIGDGIDYGNKKILGLHDEISLGISLRP